MIAPTRCTKARYVARELTSGTFGTNFLLIFLGDTVSNIWSKKCGMSIYAPDPEYVTQNGDGW